VLFISVCLNKPGSGNPEGLNAALLQTMSCQGQELNLVNLVSAALVQLFGTVPSHLHDLTDTKASKNGSKSVLFERAYM